MLNILKYISLTILLLSPIGSQIKAQETKYVTAVVLRDLQPNSFVNPETNELQGFSIEMCDILFAKLNYKVNYLIVNDWAEAEEALISGDADFCPMIAVNKKRENFFLLTDPVQTFGVTIYTRKNTKNITNVQSLGNKKVGVMIGSQAFKLIENLPAIDIQKYASFQVAIFDLLAGHIDAFVAPEYVINDISQAALLEDKLKMVSDPIKEYKRAFAFTYRDKELFEELNQLIHPFVSSTDYEHIYQKWFSPKDPFWTPRRVLIIVSSISLLLIMMIVAFYWQSLIKMNKQLKKHIQEKDEINNNLQGSLNTINEMNDVLEKARLKAEESDKLKTTFLANLSHEIRTPMNGILGFTTLLKKANLSVETRTQYLKVIEESGDRLLKLIAGLVDISKIESGEVCIITESTDINTILRKLYNHFEKEAKKKNLEISVPNNINEINMVLIDQIKVEQVLVNLINNALKYTEKGEISFGYECSEKEIIFQVKDTGLGVKPDKTSIIFERFRQAEASYIASEEGIGLGLAICKSYVELMGGRIWVESKLNIGSIFYFTIPLSDEYKPSPAEPISIPKIKLNKDLSILIADDDPMSAILLKETLLRRGIHTMHAKNGKEALEMASERPFSLILMDLKMPIMDGITAIRRIREFDQATPIIIQSGYASQQDIDKGFNAGCTDYVTKPVDLNNLLHLIAEYQANN